MQLFQRSLWLTVSFSLLSSAFVAPVLARQTTVTGTADMIYDFRERTYDHESSVLNENVGDKQKTGIGPGLSVVSKGIHDNFSLSYAPLFNYDFVTDTSGVDHNLKLSEKRDLSRFWSFAVSDDFIRSDDPSLASSSSTATDASSASGQPSTISGNELSRDLSGRRYLTNTATARTTYTLAENSRIGGGYSYALLRNDDDGSNGFAGGGSNAFADYDKHSFFSDYSYGFNQNWRTSVGLNYTRGLYDSIDAAAGTGTSLDSPDLNQYGTDFGVDYVRSVNNFFPLKYSFSGTQYDGDTRPDSEAHQWSAGWDHAFDARTRLALGGGPSYTKTQGVDGSWGYNAYLTYAKKYEHAAYALLFDKRYEARNFTGNNTQESGLTDTYNAKATFTYQYTQALGLDMYGRYSWQSTLDPQGQSNQAAPADNSALDKNIYEAGAGFSYSFAQWYKAGIKYVYYVSDGNLDSNQYTDHRVLFTLAASKDLWRW